VAAKKKQQKEKEKNKKEKNTTRPHFFKVVWNLFYLLDKFIYLFLNNEEDEV